MPPEDNNTMSRVLSDQERRAIQVVKDTGLLFHQLIDSLGKSREISIARTKIEEAVMWAVKHITSDEPPTLRRRLLDIFDTIAAAIEAKNSGDNPAYDTHLANLDSQVAALQGTEAGNEQSIAAVEAGLQKIATAVAPPPPASLTVSPSSLTGAVGQAITGSLSVSGGVGPYSYASSLSDVSVDSSGTVSGTPAAAETGTITVTDSSSPPLTATVGVTIS